MELNGQTEGGLTVYCADAFNKMVSLLQPGIIFESFKVTADDHLNDWTVSRRVDYVLCWRP